MVINVKTVYDKFSRKIPFLRREGRSVFNGHFDVTGACDYLKGIKTGLEEVRLLDYLVYRPLPKAITDLRNKPDVHPDSYEMQLYYKKVFTACREGIQAGAEYYNPMFCFWVILFIFEIPIYDKKGNVQEGFEIGRPIYSVIDRYIFDLIWKGYKLREYIALMGGRGIGKSYIVNSVLAWFYMLEDNQEIIVSATSDPIVEEAWNKVTSTIDFIEAEYPGLAQKQMKMSEKKIVAAEEYTDSKGNKKQRGSLNEIRRITYADNANVTRGRRPHFQHIEEFASFPSHPSKGSLKNCLGQSKGSWKVMGSIKKAFVIMTGTGGSVNNTDAFEVFTNPRANNLLPIGEWGEIETGLFIPAFLKYGGTWEHTGVPDIGTAMKLIVNSRKALESDPTAYTQELQEFPITLEEVFTIRGTNNFNQDKIAEQIVSIKQAKKAPWKTGRLDYTLDANGNVTGVTFVEAAGGKIIIIEEPTREPDGSIQNNLYVGGVDSIDQGNKDSLVAGSKLACAIKKRFSNNMFSHTSNLYVAFYNERSDDVRWDYENVLKLSIYYHARLNIEYTKINIISFFREKKQFWRLLKRPSIAIGSNVSGVKASELIGTPATVAVIAHQDQKLASYIDDYYYLIMYLPFLEQLRDYSVENRTKFDLVVAAGLAELADEDFMGKPASDSGNATKELTSFGAYRDANGRKRWGIIPVKESAEINTILEEEAQSVDRFQWVESTAINK